MKLLIHFSLLFIPLFGFSQAGTTINYEDQLGPLTLTYDGLVNGKHSYSTTVDNLTVAWSGSQWEITCCGGDLLFTSATMTAMNPPNLSIGNWVDLLSNNLTVFSGSGTSSVLPVKYVRLEGESRNGKSILKWTTATEINNLGFEIQRSEDGFGFYEIGFVDGSMNSTRVVDYSFEDDDLYSIHEYFYRLRQIDLDGRFEYSEIVNLVNRDIDQSMSSSIFPNPVSGDQLTLNISSMHNLDLSIEFLDLRLDTEA